MDLLNIGQKVTLSFVKENKIVEVISVISDIYSDRMTVDLPTYFMRYIQYLSVGSRLTAKVFSKIGTLNFNSIILKSPLEGDFTIELDRNSIKIEPADEIPPINAIETLYIKKSGEEDELVCNTFEISMNGVKFNSNTELKVNSEVACRLDLPENIGIISFTALIKERSLLYDSEYTAIYMTVTEEVRENLLYYMYMYSQKNTDGND